MTDLAGRADWVRPAIWCVVAIELLGGASGWLSNSGFGNAWFDALQKPSFMPPGWAFGMVWPILYAMLGVALGMILVEPPSFRRRLALALFVGQLVLNFSWSPIFFAAHEVTVAKYVIFLMAAVAAAAARQFLQLRKAAGLLLVPYLGWLVFAATLNSTIEAINPGQ